MKPCSPAAAPSLSAVPASDWLPLERDQVGPQTPGGQLTGELSHDVLPPLPKEEPFAAADAYGNMTGELCTRQHGGRHVSSVRGNGPAH